MKKIEYKAQIFFDAYEDVYEDGRQINCDNSWDEVLTAKTQKELKEKILETTYSKEEWLDDEQINEYDWCTEYHTSYLANAENVGDASEDEIEEWKKGKLRLWAVNCHILVTKVTEAKASL